MLKNRTAELDKKIAEIEQQRMSTVNIANDLEEINITLQDEIDERKRAEEESRKRLHELEIFYKATLGRENRIIELKQEINKLLEKLGKKYKYGV